MRSSSRYITDVITPDEALEMLRSKAAGKAEREAEVIRNGYPGEQKVALRCSLSRTDLLQRIQRPWDGSDTATRVRFSIIHSSALL